MSNIDIAIHVARNTTRDDIEKLIAARKSFKLTAVQDIGVTVKTLESVIESQGLQCRIYTEYRAAGLAAAAWGPTIILGAACAAAIAVHNAVTWNPDYEIGKNYKQNTLTVIYQRDEGPSGKPLNGSAEDTSHAQNNKTTADNNSSVAEKACRSAKIEARLIELEKTVGDSWTYFSGIIAMQAVALAVAHADGTISDTEKQHISELLNGVSAGYLPANVKSRIQELTDNPVTIHEAFRMAKESGLPMELFDDILYITVHADSVFHPQEQQFMETWEALKSAA